jgi:hypothetical protein
MSQASTSRPQISDQVATRAPCGPFADPQLRRGDHVRAFIVDQAFTCYDDGPHRGSFVLHERAAMSKTSPSTPAKDILGLYLERIGQECSHMKLEGIGHAGEATRYPIEEMYVRLTAHSRGEVGGPDADERMSRGSGVQRTSPRCCRTAPDYSSRASRDRARRPSSAS